MNKAMHHGDTITNLEKVVDMVMTHNHYCLMCGDTWDCDDPECSDDRCTICVPCNRDLKDEIAEMAGEL